MLFEIFGGTEIELYPLMITTKKYNKNEIAPSLELKEMENFVNERNLYLEKTIKFFAENDWDSKNEIYYENNRSFFFFTIRLKEIKIKIYCDPLYGEINLRYASEHSDWFEIYELDKYVKNPLELEKMNVRDNFKASYNTVLNYINSNMDYMKQTSNWILE